MSLSQSENQLTDEYLKLLLNDLQELKRNNFCVKNCQHKNLDNPDYDPHAKLNEKIKLFQSINFNQSKMETKDRAAVLAEREAKKLAKLAKKGKKVSNDPPALNIEVKELKSSVVDKKKEEDPNKSEISKENCVSDTKSKSELKAERRAKQEAQRAAKVAQRAPSVPETPLKSIAPETPKKSPKSQPNEQINNAPLLFNHLCVERASKTNIEASNLHPSIIRLGLKYKSGQIVGSNARCIAMLHAIKDMLNEYQTPPAEEYGRSFETILQKSVDYLRSCRPLAVSMINTLRFLKFQLTQLANNTTDDKGCSIMINSIETYIHDQIEMAGKAISITLQKKIVNGDIILTLGYSSLIKQILIDARESGKMFQVVIVETKPFQTEAKEMMRNLLTVGIKCNYCTITSVSNQMRLVTKVILGAHALLANGYVMSRIGTAQVALIAKAFNKPVLIGCETYKFCERVQTDSFVYNEIAAQTNENEIAQGHYSKEILSSPWIIPLHLTYDVTPTDLVTAVVTELAILPCTSVPVILREKPTDS